MNDLVKCPVCSRSMLAVPLQDAQFVALGERVCSFDCYRDAYSLTRFDDLKLPLHLHESC